MHILFVVMLISGFFLLIIGIILMFLWDVPTLQAELSGKNARKRSRLLEEALNNGSVSTTEMYELARSGNVVDALQDFDSSLPRATDFPIGGATSVGSDYGTPEGVSKIEQSKALAELPPLAVVHDTESGVTDGFVGEQKTATDVLTEVESLPSVDFSTGVFDEDEFVSEEPSVKDVFSASRRVVLLSEKCSFDVRGMS